MLLLLDGAKRTSLSLLGQLAWAPLCPGLGGLYSRIAGGGARWKWLSRARDLLVEGACLGVQKPPSRASLPLPEALAKPDRLLLIWQQFPVIPRGHRRSHRGASSLVPARLVPLVTLQLRSHGAKQGLGPMSECDLIFKRKSHREASPAFPNG